MIARVVFDCAVVFADRVRVAAEFVAGDRAAAAVVADKPTDLVFAADFDI